MPQLDLDLLAKILAKAIRARQDEIIAEAKVVKKRATAKHYRSRLNDKHYLRQVRATPSVMASYKDAAQ